MKKTVLFSVILGLHSSIFTVDAQQACEAGKSAWNNIGVQLVNPQNSRSQNYTEMRVRLQSKGNWH